ncbi:SDR family NAD(P)-dependent oxidoreductase [Streptomyces sp. ISL-11]|uniref:SDR family NAD(P)-dependent oxidoreductase n=1 Tax=Streptomyces sp. ISL-11 TaxID=2819174 RepID=UPI001BEAB8D7|nr:SDR family oxidoreductase [Streptomyces sp. ISL-11]MBT2383365.1 SDR family oxidoreductase [Streptomyces sp. ISL-11]
MTGTQASPLAIVSGGTRGIGRTLSERLVKLGHRVVALYRSDETAARALRDDLGPAVHTVRADIADADAVRAAVAAVTGAHGAPALLVNNAGINIDKPFLEITPEEWRRVLDTNLSGAFHLTQAVVPHMLERPDGGNVINIGATTGIRPRTDGAGYCASKAGLLHLTKCLALELAPRIRVNCLIPGMTWTEELVERFHLDDPVARESVLRQIPQRRIGSTSDIADALEFLTGASSAYITGQKLIVDGGQFMW